jgi:hypothetical protein
LGFLAALLALVTGILAAVSSSTSHKNESLTITLSQANSAKASAEASVSAAQSTISDLQSQLAAPSASPPPPQGPTVRNQGVVKIANAQNIDFDGTGKTWENGAPIYDIHYFASGDVQFVNGATAVIIPSQATYDSCHTTGYGTPTIGLSASTQPGTNICLKTSEHRFVALKLLSITKDAIQFDAVSYDPPDSQ